MATLRERNYQVLYKKKKKKKGNLDLVKTTLAEPQPLKATRHLLAHLEVKVKTKVVGIHMVLELSLRVSAQHPISIKVKVPASQMFFHTSFY